MCLNELVFLIFAVNNSKGITLWASHAVILCCLKFIVHVLPALYENGHGFIPMIGVYVQQAEAS